MPEHFKKYVNRKINPSYCTDYDKTYISSYKSPHHPKINFRLEKLSWELEFLFVNKPLSNSSASSTKYPAGVSSSPVMPSR